MIQVENVSFAYSDQAATVKDLSFHIEKGEFVALLGANGTGKTTTVRLIDGLLRPTKGRVLIQGADTAVTSVSERARHVGFLFQNPDRQICKNTVREEIMFGLRTVRDDESEEQLNARCDKVLEDFGFTGEEEPFSLSRGQRQRVALASILAVEPEILILDEPTAGQDYRHYTEIMEFLRGLNREMGLTILMITHDMHLMLEYTDRALVLTGGELIGDRTPAEILTDPEITERASLKKTSLYDLALTCGISDPAAFAHRFILYERSLRQTASGQGREVQ